MTMTADKNRAVIDVPCPSWALHPPAPSSPGTNPPRKEGEGTTPLADGFEEAIAWLRRVVAGERIWLAVDKAGEETVRSATGDETMAACDKLLKYGAGAKEGSPPPPDDTGARLDRLGAEDLATLARIAARAYVGSDSE